MEMTTTVAATEAMQPVSISKAQRWTGVVMSTLSVLFLGLDAIAKLAKPAPVVQGTVTLGYQESVLLGLGIVLLACTVIYAIPRTAVLGAILLTGYLGGAVATHVRVADPLFTHTLFPVYVGVLVWGGVFLREPRLRKLVPLRRKAGESLS
jgi:hypothetical protein